MPYPTPMESPELFSIMNDEINAVKQAVKPGEQVLLALSGGVDSFVAAVMIHNAIGDQLRCVFVDHGGMRHGEADSIKALFAERFGKSFVAVDASKEYLKAIKGVTDSEILRKIIGKKFIDVFARVADKFDNIKYFGQGTIKTDLDESGVGDKKFIKTHHNTGIDEFIKAHGWTLVEPLKQFMKQEVRTVGSWLDIPEEHLARQPFPGPGNYLRVIGGDVTGKDLKLASKFDAVVRNRIDAARLPDAKQYYGAMAKNVEFISFNSPRMGSYGIYIVHAQKIIKSIAKSEQISNYSIKIAPEIKVTGIRDEARAEEPIMVISNDVISMDAFESWNNVSHSLYEIQCKLADAICAEMPIGRVMFTWDMPAADSSKYNFIVRAVNTLNFKEAAPTCLDIQLQQAILNEFGRNKAIFFDMTRKPSATIEYR